MEQYDLIIIGGGPAGYKGAILAGKLGLKVALIEKDKLGGTCLNRGCIPTKTLLHYANDYRRIINFHDQDIIEYDKFEMNMDHLNAYKESVIDNLRNGIQVLMKKNKVTVINGTGYIIDNHHVKVDDIYETKYILIATGSSPTRLNINGIDLAGVMTSDDILKETKFYPNITIIGGGVIGMEFASVYNALGAKVTIIEYLDRILANMDKEISQNLKMIMKKRGVDIHTGAKLTEIKQQNNQLVCIYEEKGKLLEATSDAVLMATGRSVDVDSLFIGEVKPQSQRGHLITDENGQTSIYNIYAAGDVTCGIQLAHSASAQAENIVYDIAHQLNHEIEPLKCDLNYVPSCVYTEPEIATIGLTQQQAKEDNIPIIIKKYPMSANAKTVITKQDRGFIKIIACKETHQILGAQLMCARATDMIGELALGIVNKMKLEDIAKVIHPHPTYCEAIEETVKI